VFRLALLFIAVPILELALLIEIGRRLGTAPTLALVIVTGIVGAYLTRRQGVAVLRHIRADVSARRVPASHLADGALILLAGALLITPGALTDAFGFFCLIPAGRKVLRRGFRAWAMRAVGANRVQVAWRRAELLDEDERDDRSGRLPPGE
jgi:UPF0716 protein FxsA